VIPLRVRQFKVSDLERVLAIEQAAFLEDAWNEKLFLAYHRRCQELFFVAMERRRIVGYIITCAGSRNAELASIAVDPRDRRQGVGYALVEHTIAELRTRRVKTWWLMVEVTNEAAIRFYQRYGFERGKRVKRYYGPGRDGWRMHLEISRPQQ